LSEDLSPALNALTLVGGTAQIEEWQAATCGVYKLKWYKYGVLPYSLSVQWLITRSPPLDYGV
jgi:hypothetical protein